MFKNFFFLFLITVSFLKYNQLSAAVADKGKKVFNKCEAFHSIDIDAVNKVEPNLYEFFVAKYDSTKSYIDSKWLKEYGIFWNENLITWILPKKVTGAKIVEERKVK